MPATLLGTILKNGVMLGVYLLTLFFLYKAGENWKDKYYTLERNIQTVRATKDAEIATAKKFADKQAAVERAQYMEQIKARLGVIEQLGDKNEDLKTTVNSIRAERDRLRRALAASSIISLPERESSIGSITIGGTDCDTVVTTEEIIDLRKSCADTTDAYNQLRREFDRNCELTGCE